MIQNIKIELIENHPDNPRKDVGDVTELADSIRESGILQNLTVVPHEGKYRVIIGHRRLAASKLAGLTELPCVVANIDHKTQVATMLAENMQRVDLTITEQALGCQMMLDLGEDIRTIQKKTGFSENTVRKRLSIAKLNENSVKAAEQRGATIEQFVEISKIDDEAEKDWLLKQAGTASFKWELEKVLKRQETNNDLKKWFEVLNSFAEEVDCADNNYKTITSIRADTKSNFENFKIPNDANEVKYVYRIANYGCPWIYLYKEKSEEEITEEETAKEHNKRQQQEKEQRLDALRGVESKCLKRIKNFILKFNGKECFYILEFFMKHFAFDYYGQNERAIIKYFEDVQQSTEQSIKSVFENLLTEEGVVKIALLYLFERSKGYNLNFSDFNGKYSKNTEMLDFYKLLETLGYELADEEREYINGTHKLFVKDGAEDE